MILEIIITFLILAIAFYFIIKGLLKKYSRSNNTQKKDALLVTAFSSPIIFLLAVALYLGYIFYEPQYDFNSERWLGDKSKRYEMGNDIIDNEILHKMNKSEVINLLGEPDLDTQNVLHYDMGTSGAGFGWLYNGIKIKLKNDTVIDVKKIETVF